MRYDYRNDPVLQRIRKAIIEKAAPRKIILFGSRARGDASNESDYDIPIVTDDIDNERKLTRRINRRLLREDIDEAVDVIAATNHTWEKNRGNIAFIYGRIDREGIVLYG